MDVEGLEADFSFFSPSQDKIININVKVDSESASDIYPHGSEKVHPAYSATDRSIVEPSRNFEAV